MRVLKWFLFVSAICMAAPSLASDEVRPENAGPQENQSPPARAERPQRKAMKISPSVRVSPPQPDEGGNMRRITPLPSDSPLQNVPALKDAVPPGGEAAGGR